MTRPRSTLVSVLDTPYYHCICRCVRRAWLCGKDRLTGKSFEHRKPWMVERLKLLDGGMCHQFVQIRLGFNSTPEHCPE